MNPQDVPEPPLSPWRPPSYTVDRHGKVSGARPRRANNWGRWGAADQCGTANLITDDTVRAAAAAVRTGRRYSLGLPIGGPPTGAVPRAMVVRTSTTADGVVARTAAHPAYSDDLLVMGTQTYTQLDGLAHVADRDTLYNGYWAGLVTAAEGARRLGIHHLIDGIVGRGVLVDVARHLGVPVVPPGTVIGPALLDAVLRATGTTVGPGDVLLVRTGVLGSWDGVAGSLVTAPQAGLDVSCVPWLARHDVSLVGADNSAVEALDATAGSWRIPLHLAALRDLGLLLAELLCLDDLAEACAADGVWEFMFVALPLPLVGGVGSPINPLAIR
ncbi:cyclase family protein [Dactylosporangium sp. NBC_01737]|uniref:cyclase family protein n=1 Tax=Dactylosporangium sp. NBC_01737 TaxID=2975959 RepID=UPI002E13320E|nr:cyclase family protein [Dactylosporangium sp. NBC_01737]